MAIFLHLYDTAVIFALLKVGRIFISSIKRGEGIFSFTNEVRFVEKEQDCSRRKGSKSKAF